MKTETLLTIFLPAITLYIISIYFRDFVLQKLGFKSEELDKQS